MAFDIGSPRDSAVSPAEEDLVVGPADHGDEVAGGHSEDISAGDGVRASELERGLGSDDDVESVAGEREVDLGVALGGVEGRGADERRGVAAIEEAIVEEEAEGCGGGGGTRDLLVGHGVLYDLVESRARF